MADLKAMLCEGREEVGGLGLMYEDENVCEQDVRKTGDGGEGIAIGLEGLEMTGIVR